MSGDRPPHRAYAEAVAHIDGPDGFRAPDEWLLDRDDTGLLCAQYWYRRTAPRTATDRERTEMPERIVPAVVDGVTGEPVSPATVLALVDGDHWPHGITVAWDDTTGWSWNTLDEYSEVYPEGWEPLPVPVLASPAALHAVLEPLFAGQDHDLPVQRAEWAPHRPDTLVDHVAARRREQAR
ncbi:hypothetical protein [Kitasatospora purpeofusca]|uniref:hypothetical protein n=1 Tax=Kitasatospora purpeofusca TaxID=67352 RepID=UPI00381D1EFE